MFQTRTANIQLTIEQIAELLRHLSSEDVIALEALLDKKTAREVLKRSRDGRKDAISHDAMVEMFS